MRLFVPSLALALLAAAGGSPRFAHAQVAAPCAFKDHKVVTVGGVKLTPMPEITEPALREIDVLLAHGCDEEAMQKLVAYATAKPDDGRVHYFRALRSRGAGDETTARLIVRELLKDYPEFDSARVLSASIALRANDYPGAKRELAKLKPRSPRDLWGFIHENTIALTEDGTDKDALAAFIALSENPDALPDARELSVQRLRYSGDPDTAERALRLQLTFESATPQHMKQAQLAMFLQQAGRADESRATLEAGAAQRPGGLSGRMLAVDLLEEAYRISPTHSAANAELVARATAAAGGDWADERGEMIFRNDQSHLLTLAIPVGEKLERAELDLLLCRSGDAQNPVAMRTLLELGGDPDIACDRRPPGSLVYRAIQQGDPQYAELNLEMLRALIDHGATITPEMVQSCQPEGGEERCTPIIKAELEAAGAKR